VNQLCLIYDKDTDILNIYFYHLRFHLFRKMLKYPFGPHFRSVCCGWSSFWQNI